LPDGRTNLDAALQVLLENEWMQKQLAKVNIRKVRKIFWKYTITKVYSSL